VRPTTLVQVVVLNIALAPVLISGWGTGHAFGVAGAGLASSIAVLIAALMLLAYFLKFERYVRFDPAQWRPQFQQWKRILAVGLPAGGEFAIVFVWMGVVYYVLRDFGAAAQAGFGIGTRVMGLIQMPRWRLPCQPGRSPARISGPAMPARCLKPS
jgi:Na+-driven multidrug efflux pump